MLFLMTPPPPHPLPSLHQPLVWTDLQVLREEKMKSDFLKGGLLAMHDIWIWAVVVAGFLVGIVCVALGLIYLGAMVFDVLEWCSRMADAIPKWIFSR